MVGRTPCFTRCRARQIPGCHCNWKLHPGAWDFVSPFNVATSSHAPSWVKVPILKGLGLPSPAVCAGLSSVADETGSCMSLCPWGGPCLSRVVWVCQCSALWMIGNWAGGGQNITAKGYMVTATNWLFYTPYMPLAMYPRLRLPICGPGTSIAGATR